MTAASFPLVGREAALVVAADAWLRAEDGHASLLMVTGEAGVGRTRFALEIADRVALDGARVVLGRCDRLPALDHQPFVEALDSLLRDALDAPARALVAAARDDEQASLVPALRAVVRDRALLLVIDDLQWADAGTAALLRRSLARLRDQRLLVVATVRTDLPPAHPIEDALRSLGRLGLVRQVHLDGLDLPAARQLAAQAAPGAGRRLFRPVEDTAGNPSLLIELLRADPARLIESRLAGLSQQARALLTAAALIGPRFDLDVVAAVQGGPDAPAVPAIEAAEAAGLVVRIESGYRFVHDVVRQHLERGLSDARRRLLHRRIADALEACGHDEPAVLAHHRCSGGDPHAALSALTAARTTAASGALTEALSWCRAALAHVTPGDTALEAEILTELGLAQQRGGSEDAAPLLLDGALRAWGSGAPDLAARAALAFADLVHDRPDDDAHPLVSEVLAAQLTTNGRLWSRLVARDLQLSPGRASDADAAAAVTLLRTELDGLVGPDHLDRRSELATDLATAAQAVGDSDASRTAARHLATIAAKRGDLSGDLRGSLPPPQGDDRLVLPLPKDDHWLVSMGRLALATVDLDDPVLATELYAELSPYPTLTCATGPTTFAGTVALHLGRLAATTARWSTAERHLTTALRQLAALGPHAHPWLTLTHHSLAHVLHARARSSDLPTLPLLRPIPL